MQCADAAIVDDRIVWPHEQSTSPNEMSLGDVVTPSTCTCSEGVPNPGSSWATIGEEQHLQNWRITLHSTMPVLLRLLLGLLQNDMSIEVMGGQPGCGSVRAHVLSAFDDLDLHAQ